MTTLSKSHRRRESGSAVIVVISILAILLIYAAGNALTLNHLGRELRLLEQKQIRRATITYTNSVPPSAVLETKSPESPAPKP